MNMPGPAGLDGQPLIQALGAVEGRRGGLGRRAEAQGGQRGVQGRDGGQKGGFLGGVGQVGVECVKGCRQCYDLGVGRGVSFKFEIFD